MIKNKRVHRYFHPGRISLVGLPSRNFIKLAKQKETSSLIGKAIAK